MAYPRSIEKEIRLYRPALYLDNVFPGTVRRWIRKTALILSILFLLIVIFAPQDFVLARESSWGLFLIGAAVVFLLFAVEFYYNSLYFRGMRSVLSKKEGDAPLLDMETADILHESMKDGEVNVLKGFFESIYGRAVIARLGLMASFDPEAIERITVEELPIEKKFPITISVLAMALLEASEELSDVLFKSGVTKEDYRGAAQWVENIEYRTKESKRLWGRDHLGRLPSIGKDWAYGTPFTILRFGLPIDETHYFTSVAGETLSHARIVRSIETILARRREANIFLVGRDRGAALEVMASVAHEIVEGRVFPALEGSNIILFSGQEMVSASTDKIDFERTFIRGMNEALKAGNVILVIEDYHAFIESAKQIGSDVVSLMDPYLSSTDLHIVAVVNEDVFHDEYENNPAISKRFDVVHLPAIATESTLHILQDIALVEESEGDVYFTYQSLEAITRGAERYFGNALLPDKAIDLLYEVAAYGKERRKYLITEDVVLERIESKTGIPTGNASDVERKKLLALEDELSERIVGQQRALELIAGALRRARSGISDPDRPIGSFLFLGPTGVGKTETAKALSDIYFEDDQLIRLDMSEFQGADGLQKLIGFFGGSESGILVSRLREKPYGVLLLDEFEKTNEKVIDLFLQIIDEGRFSDMSGRPVNARNVIIIATSNAGSDYIWEYFKSGEDPADHKEDLVDHVIEEGVFKPELINRFDGVVIYRPLSKSDLKKIARLQLEKLSGRLKEKGVELSVTPELVEYVAQEGYDPKFGARYMKRVIQECLEQYVAGQLLTGTLRQGEKVTISPEDLDKS